MDKAKEKPVIKIVRKCPVCGSPYVYYDGFTPYRCMVCEGFDDTKTPIILGRYEILQKGIGTLLDKAEAVIKRRTPIGFDEEINHDLAICAVAFFAEEVFVNFLSYYLEIIHLESPDKIKERLKNLSLSKKIYELYPELVPEDMKRTALSGKFEEYLEKWLNVIEFRNGVAHNWLFRGHDLFGRFVRTSRQGDIKYLFKHALRRDGGVRKLNEKAEDFKLESLEIARFVNDNTIRFFIYLWNKWIKRNDDPAGGNP